MVYPKLIQKLIEDLRILPGVGEKTAERYALALLDTDNEDIMSLAQNLLLVKSEIKYCQNCFNLSEDILCTICSDKSRDSSIMCIVESVKDVIAFEKTKKYPGLYHVLGNLINPSKGILPQDLNLANLAERLKDVKEVIIATNLTIAGDTTALYLKKYLLELNPDITITQLAHGLPVGGHISYADDLTIIKSLEGRIKI